MSNDELAAAALPETPKDDARYYKAAWEGAVERAEIAEAALLVERGRDEELKALVRNWRAISNDAKPSADCDLDMVVMARDGQYAETLAICATELEAALRSPSADPKKGK